MVTLLIGNNFSSKQKQEKMKNITQMKILYTFE